MPSLIVLLENIRSVYNVGSVFRTCDSAGVDKLILTGYTAHPPHPKLEKTALSAQNTVTWQYFDQTIEAIDKLKESHKIIAMEPTPSATSIYDLKFDQPTCLIFGNEVSGISPETIDACNLVAKIPMFGHKESLNIATAAGIAIYEFKRKLLTANL